LDDLDGDESEEGLVDVIQDASATVSQPQHKKIRAKFTHSRLHNEQLVVAPCGVILGRDTMFGAEGIASVTVVYGSSITYATYSLIAIGVSQARLLY
jgi:hypothetical protein